MQNMAYRVERTDAEIDAVLSQVHVNTDSGTAACPSLTFETGVAQGIEWVLGLAEHVLPLP